MQLLGHGRFSLPELQVKVFMVELYQKLARFYGLPLFHQHLEHPAAHPGAYPGRAAFNSARNPDHIIFCGL